MDNIVDYVKKMGDTDFSEAPFSTVDALVLCEFCYLKFDGLVPDFKGQPVSLFDVEASENKEDLFQDKNYEKDNRKLYNAIIGSGRFNSMRIGYYVNRVDIEAESQFAAVTFFLPGDNVFVAFRGTDETMAGWQEDFALALKKPILGQTLSAKYMDKVASLVKTPFMVGGHSKGGNLAMYAPMCASKLAKKNTSKIYIFDGPGFRPEAFKKEDYDLIKDKMVKIMPKSSPIGLLFNDPYEYQVIEAKSVGILQHNPYNWVIKKGELVPAKMTEQHLLAMRSMNEWLLSLDDQGIEHFVSMLCWILDATNATTTIEFKENAALHTRALIKAGQEADEKAKEMASLFLKSYAEFAGEMIKEDIQKKFDLFLEEVNLIKDKVLPKKKK